MLLCVSVSFLLTKLAVNVTFKGFFCVIIMVRYTYLVVQLIILSHLAGVLNTVA